MKADARSRADEATRRKGDSLMIGGGGGGVGGGGVLDTEKK